MTREVPWADGLVLSLSQWELQQVRKGEGRQAPGRQVEHEPQAQQRAGIRTAVKTRQQGKAYLGPADQAEQGQLWSVTLEPHDSGRLGHLSAATNQQVLRVWLPL